MRGRTAAFRGVALVAAVALAVLGSGRLAATGMPDADHESRDGVLRSAPFSAEIVPMQTPPAAAPTIASTPTTTMTYVSEIGDVPAIRTPPLTASPSPLVEVRGLTVFPEAGGGDTGSAAAHVSVLVVLGCLGAFLLAVGLAMKVRVEVAD